MISTPPSQVWLSFLFCFIAFLATPVGVTGQLLEVYDVSRLGADINTHEFDEIAPVVTSDDHTLYFTRTGSPDFNKTHMNGDVDMSLELSPAEYKDYLAHIFSSMAGDDIPDPVASAYNQDVWVARMINDVFSQVYHPGPPLNNALPNSIVSPGEGENNLIAINQFYSDGSMYEGFSIIGIDENGDYEFPEPLHIYDFYNLSGDVNLSMTADGLIMIMSLEREDSYGNNDLYVSFRSGKDIWSKPVHIGESLNTPFQESTPFISRDRKYVYFSSDRPGGLGGTDIWVSKRLDYSWLEWSEPERFDAPVNSAGDDAYACVNAEKTHMYFSSRRDGSSDIFDASLIPPVVLEKPLDIVCRVVDSETGDPIRAELFWGPDNVDGYLEYFETYTGEMATRFDEPEVYKFLAQKRGYEPATLMFDAVLASKQDLPVYYVVIRMDRKKDIVKQEEPESEELGIAEEIAILDVGETISFYNIYFERTKATVLPQSHAALDELVEGLTDNPGVNIRIEGHTDNVGNNLDLMELSWSRAESIKTYLVTNGIEEARIAPWIWSEQPVSDNNTEEGRKRNRRVEIRIISRM